MARSLNGIQPTTLSTNLGSSPACSPGHSQLRRGDPPDDPRRLSCGDVLHQISRGLAHGDRNVGRMGGYHIDQGVPGRLAGKQERPLAVEHGKRDCAEEDFDGSPLTTVTFSPKTHPHPTTRCPCQPLTYHKAHRPFGHSPNIARPIFTASGARTDFHPQDAVSPPLAGTDKDYRRATSAISGSCGATGAVG
jgi:hypothetical protein